MGQLRRLSGSNSSLSKSMEQDIIQLICKGRALYDNGFGELEALMKETGEEFDQMSTVTLTRDIYHTVTVITPYTIQC